jgi:NAD(P)-dependent dehydrogenase (short-subunit alcohol dehydrogenase family)
MTQADDAAPPQFRSADLRRMIMDLELAGKVAVVTGAGDGIGLAATKTLAAEGALVVAGSRSTGNLDGLEHVTPVAIDLTPSAAPAQLVQRAIDEHGRVDIVVNNVGAAHLRLPGFLTTTDDDFEWAMQMNFYIAVRTTRAAIAHMLDAGGGTVVSVASVNSFYHPDSVVMDYGAAKAALVNLTKALSQEFGPRGIRLNCISPGPVGTGFWLGPHGVAATVAAATGVDPDTAREQIVAGMGGIPTGRFTTPDEVAVLIAFLASPRTANVTGSNYLIDGGLIKTT